MADVQVRVVARGLRFPEGPSFDAVGRLYVVELGRGCVTRIDTDTGACEPFARMAGAPNGSTFGPDGRLWIANNGGRHAPAVSTDGRPGLGGEAALIQRVDADGTVTDALAAIDGAPLVAPNDLCFDADGNLWFTDPAWPALDERGVLGEVPVGPIACLAPDGRAWHVPTGLRFPNGIAVVPGGGAVVVSESGTGALWRFDVRGPGEVAAPVLHADCGAGSLPDGFAFDAEGRLLVAGHKTAAIHVFAPDGREERRIGCGEHAEPSNLAFGGPDGRTVFVTDANLGTVLAFDWPTPGLPLAGRPGW